MAEEIKAEEMVDSFNNATADSKADRVDSSVTEIHEETEGGRISK